MDVVHDTEPSDDTDIEALDALDEYELPNLGALIDLHRERAAARWMTDALCRRRRLDPEDFFPARGESTAWAKGICAECAVTEPCLQYALDHNEKFGIWGGKSERERRRLRRLRRSA